MKFLLVVSMLLSSVFANANDSWDINCYEKGPRDLDLIYKIRVDRSPAIETSYQLLDCHLLDSSMDGECRDRGYLRRIEMQHQNCLVSAIINSDPFSLCHENQETLVEERRLVPVRITDDHQKHRAYCDRSILRIL